MAPFCSCPASLVSRKFFAVGPGCAKCFVFCCAPLGAATFRRGQSKKKNTTQGVFFFAPAPGKGKGRRSPVGRRHGARAKKKTPPRVLFFFCGPGEKQGKEKPRWAPARGQSKKKTPWVVFFFLLWPRVGAQRGFSFACLSPGPQQKKKKNTLGGVFFFCSGPVPAPNGASPSLAFRRGRSKKKNTLGGVFVFAAAPHSLTAGLGGDASPSPGWCFFFAAAPPGPGWCVFFCCGPARTLTHSRWAGAISARPGWCFFFFAAAPPGLGYYIGSKKTRRGHSKKKNTTSGLVRVSINSRQVLSGFRLLSQGSVIIEV